MGKTLGNVRRRSRQEPLADLHQFLLDLDGLKTVLRQNPIASEGRRETTAEHSWHLAMAVLLFARYAAEDVDINVAVSLAVVHDIPEVFVGDTFVYSPQIASRHSHELDAMKEMAKSHRDLPEVKDIYDKWEQYESCLTPEGRFVMAMDVLLPVFLNYANLPNSSWQHHGVHTQQVQQRIAGVRSYCPEVAELASQLVQKATDRGVLRGTPR